MKKNLTRLKEGNKIIRMEKRKKFLRFTTVLVMVVGLCGCATVQLGTPSGKPEVTIPNVTQKQVVDALVNQMIAGGYQVQSMNNYRAVFGKKDNSLASSLLLGSKWNTTPEYRIIYNFVVTNEGVRIIITNIEGVTNPGTGFERITDLNQGKVAQSWQNMLEQLKSSLLERKAIEENIEKGKIGVTVKHEKKNGSFSYVVVKVIKNSPAEKVGLQQGDMIIEVDSKVTKNLLPSEFARLLTGQPGTSVTLKVGRNGQEFEVTIVREESHSP